MVENKTSYARIFLYYFLIVEIGLIGGLIFYQITYGSNDINDTIIFGIFSTALIAIIFFIIYFRNPDPDKIIPKSYFLKIGKLHGTILLTFPFSLIFALLIPKVFRNFFPMPISNFYGILVLILFLIWYLTFIKQVIQILDVLTMFIKDGLYPNTWPAEIREENRNINLEKTYLRWLHKFGTDEERSYYHKVSFEDKRAGTNYAASRIRKIKEETGFK